MTAHTNSGPAPYGCVMRIDHAEMLPGMVVVVVVVIVMVLWLRRQAQGLAAVAAGLIVGGALAT